MKTILKKKTVQAMLVSTTMVLLSACGGGGGGGGNGGNGAHATVLDCHLGAGETLTLTNHSTGTDYIVDCVYTVSGNMVIEPGVTIEFLSDTGFEIDGNQASLKAVGTQAEPITFTNTDGIRGAWRGIFFDSNNVKNELSHTIIEYAGGGAFNSNGDKGSVIIYAGAQLKANNNELYDGKSYGFNLSYNGSDVVLKDNTIETHKAPMYLKAQYVDRVQGGTYTGNDTDAIFVPNSGIGDTRRFRDLGVPYHVVGNLVVGMDGKLTIDPGVTMKFGQNVIFSVNEHTWNGNEHPYVRAIGTANKKITFTTIVANGLWKGFSYDTENSLNALQYAVINNAEKGVYAWYHTKLTIDHVDFADISSHAIHVKAFSDTTENVHVGAGNSYTHIGGNNIQADHI